MLARRPANESPAGADGGAILHAEPNPLILCQMIAKPPQLSANEQINSSLEDPVWRCEATTCAAFHRRVALALSVPQRAGH